jgi:hypothetical protein
MKYSLQKAKSFALRQEEVKILTAAALVSVVADALYGALADPGQVFLKGRRQLQAGYGVVVQGQLPVAIGQVNGAVAGLAEGYGLAVAPSLLPGHQMMQAYQAYHPLAKCTLLLGLLFHQSTD